MGKVKSTQDFYIKMLHLTNNAKKLNFSPSAKMKIYTLSKAPLAHKTSETLHMDLLCNYFKWSLKANSQLTSKIAIWLCWFPRKILHTPLKPTKTEPSFRKINNLPPKKLDRFFPTYF